MLKCCSVLSSILCSTCSLFAPSYVCLQATDLQSHSCRPQLCAICHTAFPADTEALLQSCQLWVLESRAVRRIRGRKWQEKNCVIISWTICNLCHIFLVESNHGGSDGRSMWPEWGRREMLTGVCRGKLMGKAHSEDLEADGRVKGK